MNTNDFLTFHKVLDSKYSVLPANSYYQSLALQSCDYMISLIESNRYPHDARIREWYKWRYMLLENVGYNGKPISVSFCHTACKNAYNFGWRALVTA